MDVTIKCFGVEDLSYLQQLIMKGCKSWTIIKTQEGEKK